MIARSRSEACKIWINRCCRNRQAVMSKERESLLIVTPWKCYGEKHVAGSVTKMNNDGNQLCNLKWWTSRSSSDCGRHSVGDRMSASRIHQPPKFSRSLFLALSFFDPVKQQVTRLYFSSDRPERDQKPRRHTGKGLPSYNQGMVFLPRPPMRRNFSARSLRTCRNPEKLPTRDRYA